MRIFRFPPLIFDLEAEQDTDHFVSIFKVRGHWGAVAKSNFTGCRYPTGVSHLRELAMSYFNIYFNLAANTLCDGIRAPDLRDLTIATG